MGRGADLTISKTHMAKLAQSGGNIFSTALSLVRPLLALAAKALATAGLSFGAEKILKKIPGGTTLPDGSAPEPGPEKGY